MIFLKKRGNSRGFFKKWRKKAKFNTLQAPRHGQVRFFGKVFFGKQKKTWGNGEFLRKIEGKRQNLGEKGNKWLGQVRKGKVFLLKNRRKLEKIGSFPRKLEEKRKNSMETQSEIAAFAISRLKMQKNREEKRQKLKKLRKV